jgi:hypothetical protein
MNLKLLLEFDKWIKENPKGGIFVRGVHAFRVSVRGLKIGN